MVWTNVFGIRIFECWHGSHHEKIFRNLNTGEEAREDELEWHHAA
jgi:hypothetical protein